MIDGFQRAGLCRGNFFIFQILDGSSHCLERFWARYPISRAEWAGQPFSVVAAWRPSKRAKPAAWDPLPDCRSGLVLGDLPDGFLLKQLFCIVRINCFWDL